MHTFQKLFLFLLLIQRLKKNRHTTLCRPHGSGSAENVEFWPFFSGSYNDRDPKICARVLRQQSTEYSSLHSTNRLVNNIEHWICCSSNFLDNNEILFPNGCHFMQLGIFPPYWRTNGHRKNKPVNFTEGFVLVRKRRNCLHPILIRLYSSSIVTITMSCKLKILELVRIYFYLLSYTSCSFE